MKTVPLHGDLQIDQDLRFSKREWRTQHAGWLLMLILIAAAALGLFGHGPLASRHAQTPDGRLKLDYDAVARHSAPDILRIEIAADAVSDGTVSIWFDRAYIHARTVESISPEPALSGTSGDRIAYEFRIADRTQAAIIAFHTSPRDMGRQRGAAGLVGGDSLRFSQIVLP